MSKINKAWEPHESHDFRVCERIYDAHACQRYAKELKLGVVEIDLSTMYLDYPSPCCNSLIDFARHIQQTLDADLDRPIILNEEGVVIDGKHRIAKALLDGKTHIKAVKFDEDHPGTYREG